MYSVDKPYVKALIVRHKTFLKKTAFTKNFKTLTSIIKSAKLTQLNILLRVLFLVVHHHIRFDGKISTQMKKKLLAEFYKESSFKTLLYAKREKKENVLKEVSASFKVILKGLFKHE